MENQDNLATQSQDNTQTQQEDTTTTQDTTTTTQAAAPIFTWKSKLGADISNAPTLQKFEDTTEGLSKAFESHLSLEKLLGHEKVPIPKDANDTEGWARFSKAMGIPEKAEGYGLTDVELPGNMKDMSFDKKQFAETVHKHKLTPSQAKGLWQDYTKMSMDAYGKFLKEHQDHLNNVVNTLRAEWGDAYDVNVELGQTVINKFAGDKETEDFLTATFTKDPRAVKFLAAIGNQFAENKVGEFQLKRFTLSPDDANAEINKILQDPAHPYLNDKATPAEREKAISYVNSLYALINKAKKG